MRKRVWAVAVLALGGAVLLVGIALFWRLIPSPQEQSLQPRDAVVVLTGDAGRLQTAYRLWQQGVAGRLVISGLGAGITTAQALTAAGLPLEREGEILADHARDTAGNLVEVVAALRRLGLTSAYLVTSDYHIPRVMLLWSRLKGARPELKQISLVPMPVATGVHPWSPAVLGECLWFLGETLRPMPPFPNE